MNGATEINEDELLDTLERITPAQFARLVFTLKVPKNLMPSEDKELTLRAIALLEWAKAPKGCGLDKIQQALRKRPLGQLHCPSKDPNQIHNIAEAMLRNFDHQKTLEVFKDIVKQIEERERAGIFLLQGCKSQGGKYCFKKLSDYLRSDTAASKFPEPYNIHPLGGEMTPKGLLCRMACALRPNQHLGELIEKDVEYIRNFIIKAIEDLVPEDYGFTYLFHIKHYDYLLQMNFFWEFFLKNFWVYFCEKLPDFAKKNFDLKLIFLFQANESVEVLPEYLYRLKNKDTQEVNDKDNHKDFRSSKIVKLPLGLCEISEIRSWLIHSQNVLPKETIEDIMFKIENKYIDRAPDSLYDLLLDTIKEVLKNEC